MPLSSSHVQALAGFRRALRRFLAYSEAITHAAGVTPQQYQVLLALKALPPGETTVKALAEEILLKHHSAVELTKRMERAGLVTRLRRADDRRNVVLDLTPRGEALLGELVELHRTELLKHAPLVQESMQRLTGEG